MTKQSNIDDKLLARKNSLAQMLDYSENSVVSRTIIKKETGTITLFAFDAGQGLSKHSAPFEALVEIIDGSAEIIIEDDAHSLEKGEAIILPANIPHAVNAEKQFKMILTMIKS